MRSLFHFLQEPFESACLEPLRSRINSSNVSPDFRLADAGTDQRVIDEARQLERELMNDSPEAAPCPAAAAELEADLEKRVSHIQNVNGYYKKALGRIAKLEKEIEQLKRVPRRRRDRWLSWAFRKKTTA